jgi:NAD(P)-dependent dehydrogenase (short-subunit alcohol dehydrogenase family)
MGGVSMLLQDRVAIVTGAGRGIGRAIALRFAQEGAKILGFDRDAKSLDVLADEVRRAGGKCEVVMGTVASSADINRMVETAMRTFGRIDILVNNAGVGFERPFLELTEADWDTVVGINLKGMFLCTLAAAREMTKQGGGRIINMASICSYVVAEGDRNVLYHTSKGGIVQLTRSTAVALAPHNIIVNGIAPGLIYTDLTKHSVDGKKEENLQHIVMKRIGQPEDVAELALFLATETTKYLIGQIIVLDGGWTLRL